MKHILHCLILSESFGKFLLQLNVYVISCNHGIYIYTKYYMFCSDHVLETAVSKYSTCCWCYWDISLWLWKPCLICTNHSLTSTMYSCQWRCWLSIWSSLLCVHGVTRVLYARTITQPTPMYMNMMVPCTKHVTFAQHATLVSRHDQNIAVSTKTTTCSLYLRVHSWFIGFNAIALLHPSVLLYLLYTTLLSTVEAQSLHLFNGLPLYYCWNIASMLGYQCSHLAYDKHAQTTGVFYVCMMSAFVIDSGVKVCSLFCQFCNMCECVWGSCVHTKKQIKNIKIVLLVCSDL